MSSTSLLLLRAIPTSKSTMMSNEIQRLQLQTLHRLQSMGMLIDFNIELTAGIKIFTHPLIL